MKKILISLITASVLASQATAQFSENFEQNMTSLTGNCWRVEQVEYSTTSSDVISGNGSAYTNPPTSGSGERVLATPFLNMTSTSLTVSFKYKTSSKINGNATRTLNIGIADRNGNFVSLQVITMDKNTSTAVLTHNATYTIPSTGVYRLEIRIGGSTGDGNSRVIFDDLNISASAYYGPVVHCNPAAVAVNDSYSYSGIHAVSDSVKANDNIPADNEVYNVSVVTPPTSGTLVMNANGTFTYTPDPTFTGGAITFTYQITDNGYPSTTSNIATVTLNFPIPVILPIDLRDFKAIPMGENVKLNWLVDKNEDGDYFEVERSADGQHFKPIAKIFSNNHVNEYSAYDKAVATAVYYRLKVVNNDASVIYSKTVLVKGNTEATAIRVLGTTTGSVLTFSYQAAENTNSQVQIYSINGVRVQQAFMSLNKGAGRYQIDVMKLQPGTYVIKVISANGDHAVKFVKS